MYASLRINFNIKWLFKTLKNQEFNKFNILLFCYQTPVSNNMLYSILSAHAITTSFLLCVYDFSVDGHSFNVISPTFILWKREIHCVKFNNIIVYRRSLFLEMLYYSYRMRIIKINDSINQLSECFFSDVSLLKW